MSALSAQRVATMPASRRLCAVYAAIAIVALIAVGSQLGPYLHSLSAFFVSFWSDSKATPASRLVTADIHLFGLFAAILMVLEARKYDVRFVWAYIVAAILVPVSVTFPLFLIARELRMNASEARRIRATDTVLLMLLAIGMVGLTIWVVTA